MEQTLKQFLFSKRLELYEYITDLQSANTSGVYMEGDTEELDRAEAELNLIKSIISICEKRGRY